SNTSGILLLSVTFMIFAAPPDTFLLPLDWPGQNVPLRSRSSGACPSRSGGRPDRKPPPFLPAPSADPAEGSRKAAPWYRDGADGCTAFPFPPAPRSSPYG